MNICMRYCNQIIFLYQTMDKTKSYIIWWIPRSGKSQLCSRMHKELGYSWIECDAIITALQDRYKTLGISHDIDWKLWSKRFTKLANHYLEELLRTNENKVVLDSHYMHPKYINDKVKSSYNILFIWYPSISVEEKVKAIQVYDAVHHGWTEDFPEKLTDRVASRIQESKDLQTLCEQYNFPFYDVSHDYENNLNKIYDTITK